MRGRSRQRSSIIKGKICILKRCVGQQSLSWNMQKNSEAGLCFASLDGPVLAQECLPTRNAPVAHANYGQGSEFTAREAAESIQLDASHEAQLCEKTCRTSWKFGQGKANNFIVPICAWKLVFLYLKMNPLTKYISNDANKINQKILNIRQPAFFPDKIGQSI